MNNYLNFYILYIYTRISMDWCTSRMLSIFLWYFCNEISGLPYARRHLFVFALFNLQKRNCFFFYNVRFNLNKFSCEIREFFVAMHLFIWCFPYLLATFRSRENLCTKFEVSKQILLIILIVLSYWMWYPNVYWKYKTLNQFFIHFKTTSPVSNSTAPFLWAALLSKNIQGQQ